jgi:hypothetical protein
MVEISTTYIFAKAENSLMGRKWRKRSRCDKVAPGKKKLKLYLLDGSTVAKFLQTCRTR